MGLEKDSVRMVTEESKEKIGTSQTRIIFHYRDGRLSFYLSTDEGVTRLQPVQTCGSSRAAGLCSSNGTN